MRRLLPTLVLLALFTGCKGAEFVQLESRYVQVRVDDYRYDRPNLRVPPGRILFAVANDGSEPTNFRVRKGTRDLVDITTLQPKERGTIYATLRPGTYVMYSSVGRHETLGEYGTLVVSRRIASPRPAQRTETPRGLTPP